jgi:hypothetical protein
MLIVGLTNYQNAAQILLEKEIFSEHVVHLTCAFPYLGPKWDNIY